MIKTLIAAALVLIVTPALAQEVTFTCEITGSGNDGFDIYATNPGAGPKTCTAGCTVTRKNGSQKTWTYRDRVVNAAPSRSWFGGESAVSGAPLSDPKISESSCN